MSQRAGRCPGRICRVVVPEGTALDSALPKILDDFGGKLGDADAASDNPVNVVHLALVGASDDAAGNEKAITG